MAVGEELRVESVERDGTPRGEVSDATVTSVTFPNSDVGAATITIPPKGRGADLIQLLETDLQIYEGDDLLGWYTPWRDTGSPDMSSIECEGFGSLFTKRIVDRGSLLFTNIEQTAIAAALVDYAQDESVQANRDFFVYPTNIPVLTKIRSRDYSRWEHKTILDLLKEFPKLEDGFDWDFISPDGVNRQFVVYYPRRGGPKPNIVLEWDEYGTKGISTYTWNEDAVPVITEAWVTGGSSGDVKFEQNYEDLAASARFGVMQGVISEGAQKDIAWLMDRAVREVGSRNKPIKKPDVSVVRIPEDYRKLLGPGDSPWIDIDNGRHQFHSLARIGSITWQPGIGLNLAFSEMEDAA